MKLSYKNKLCESCRNKVLNISKLSQKEFQELKDCRCLQRYVPIYFKTKKGRNENGQ